MSVKIGEFPVLSVERPEFCPINGAMDLNAAGMSHLNYARGRLAREGPRPTPGDQSLGRLTYPLVIVPII
jgi:hypothetical protein